MTAAIIWLALQQIGVDSSIYDEVCLMPILPVIVVDCGK